MSKHSKSIPRPKWVFVPSLLFLSLFITGSSDQPFSYRVDSRVRPFQPTLPDSRTGGTKPLHAIRDDAGRTTTFIGNELIIDSANRADAEALAARYEGEVIGSDEIPEPPQQLQIVLPPEQRAATLYVVRLGEAAIQRFSLARFAEDMRANQRQGRARISSEIAAKLLAIMAHENARGVPVSVNFVSRPDALIFGTEERPSGTTFLNAFDRIEYQASGARADVLRAWQYLEGHRSLGGIFNRVQVAVIDGGFWLDPTGRPLGSSTDYPANPIQYDFQNDDRTAGGPNPGTCSADSSCPWHGNGSAGVATGILNNRAGAGGVGGFIADPMLFKVDLSDSNTKRAVKTAVAWGAEVANLSYSGHCESIFCQWGRLITKYYLTFAAAESSGIILVSSAGNDSTNVTNSHVLPCLLTICVGAMADGTRNAAATSGRGPGVDVWAPTNIWVMPNGLSTPNNTTHGGTSAAAPFIAGIAAMLKAVNPGLNMSAMQTILRETANTDAITDPVVTAPINAFRAAVRVTNNQLPADRFEPNDTRAAATLIGPGRTEDLSVHTVTDRDYYKIVVSDYSRLEIDLEYVRDINAPGMIVSAESGTGPVGVTDVPRPDGRGRRYRAELVAPGTYYLYVGMPVGNTTPIYYHVEVRTTVVGLNPDAFEVNDTFATAATVPDGEYDVNHHVNTDVDYYRFSVRTGVRSGITVTGHEFKVSYSDRPVTVTLYDAAGTVLATSPDRVSVSADGDYIVRVQGDGNRMRYGIESYDLLYIPSPPVDFRVPIRRVFVSDPPGWGSLIDVRDVFIFRQSPREAPLVRRMVLQGANVHVRLLDERGRQVASGRPVSSRNEGPGETLDLTRTLNGRFHYLVIERSGFDPLQVPDLDLQLPIVRYRMRFGPR